MLVHFGWLDGLACRQEHGWANINLDEVTCEECLIEAAYKIKFTDYQDLLNMVRRIIDLKDSEPLIKLYYIFDILLRYDKHSDYTHSLREH